jgi:hypothetical protein
MKKNISVFTIYAMTAVLLLTGSCNEVNTGKTAHVETDKKIRSVIIKKPGSSFNDTLIIKSNSAVFYIPDSVQMEKIKKINKKEIFDLLSHNCHYQMQNAWQVIKKDWPQIKIIETSTYRFLLFEKANKDKRCIDLNDKNDICGLFLFDRMKDPVLVDMPNINTQLRLYFSK